MGKLDRRIAVVNGAATGLGKAIALLYGAEGADVAVIDWNAEGAARTAAIIAGQGRRSLAIGADVGDESAVEKAFAQVMSELGAPHILVNNAGIATVALLEHMATAMRRNRYGRIINISSQLAHKGGSGMAHYAAAKAGILGLTRSLSYEVAADDITVNAICPGPLDTDMKLPPEWAAKKQNEL